LPTWKQITDYFTALDKASLRVSVRTLGKTTLGRPFLVAFISEPSTLANPERYRQIQRKLMDPRLRPPGVGKLGSESDFIVPTRPRWNDEIRL